MDQSKTIKTALAAADKAILLESAGQVSRAAKAWRRGTTLGLDTEFVRETTFYANLGLVQLSDGQTVWLLDPMVAGALDPFADLLQDTRITKILHSPSEDLEVFAHVTGAVPEPLVDTQLACAMLGQPLQLGYHRAAEWLLGISVEKDLTRSNWCARPLHPAQLRYAALDVCLLPLMWERLEERLKDLGRLEWLREDSARALERARTPLEPANAWRRIKGWGRFDGTSLAILKELAHWREGVAQSRNRPRGFIIPDTALLTIAREKIRTREALEQIEELHPRARQRHGKTMLQLVEESLASGRKLAPARSMNVEERKTLKEMRQRVQDTAAGLGIEPALLASKKDLEQMMLALGEDSLPPRLLGWRKSVVTDELLERRNSP